MASNKTQIDKCLYLGQSMRLTNTGDMETVSGPEAIAQAAQNRTLAYLGTWIFDDKFGSVLYTHLQDKGVADLTDEVVEANVKEALEPMLLDGRISEVNSVKILYRLDTTIYIEIQITIATQLVTITYPVTVE